MFEPAGDKCFQFLFAQEDHYYLRGLVRFDLERYLYYCLKEAGYEGIFFLQDLKGSYRVKMEDEKSLDVYLDYVKRGNSTFTGKLVKAATGIFNRSSQDTNSENPFMYRIQENGKECYEIKYKSKDKLQNFIEDLIGQENDRYAFVTSAQTFNALFEGVYESQALAEVLEEKRLYSTFFIVEPQKANESIPHLLKNRDGENSSLAECFCKEELETIIQNERRVQIFEELYNKMGDQYHVWNQLREKDIRRMLEYGMLFEAWDITPDQVEDVTAFIYAWYHSLTFAERYRNVLPKNRWGCNTELERFLVIPEKMNQVKQKVFELKQEGCPLKDTIANSYYLDEAPKTPILEETAAYRCLNGINFENVISDEESEQSEKLAEDFYLLKSELLVPYNFSGDLEKTIEWCADRLKEIERMRYIDEDSVEWILNMVNFTIHSELPDSEAFHKILGVYEQAIQASMMVSRLKNEIETENRKLEEPKQELAEKIQLAKKKRWLNAEESTISQEVFSEDLEKRHLVNLYNNLKNRRYFLQKKEKEKIEVEAAIQQLKQAIDNCRTNDTARLNAIAATLHDASEFWVESGVAETGAMKKLSDMMQKYKITEEEMHNYHQEQLSDVQIDNIYAELTAEGTEDRDTNYSGNGLDMLEDAVPIEKQVNC